VGSAFSWVSNFEGFCGLFCGFWWVFSWHLWVFVGLRKYELENKIFKEKKYLLLTRCRELGRSATQICFSYLFLENNLSDLENFYISKILKPFSLDSQIALRMTNHITVIIRAFLRNSSSR